MSVIIQTCNKMSSTSIVSQSGKTRLQAALERAKNGGAPAIGQWLEFPGYSLARTVASLGVDWVLIDCEHGNIDDAAMYHAVGAVATAGASPIVRIAGSEPWMMKRALDSGAHGIMVPMCETKEQAEMIVRATRYPSTEYPTGFRGAGAMFAPMNFNLSGQSYFSNANRAVTVIVQIESRRAVENVEEIASVLGIDALFIGPNDLAASMGYFPFDHPKIEEVQEAISKVLEVGKAAGKYVGHFALSAELAAQKVKQGFEFVNCGSDITALTSWMGGEMAKLQQMLSS